jgi:hypothetical protein
MNRTEVEEKKRKGQKERDIYIEMRPIMAFGKECAARIASAPEPVHKSRHVLI